MVKKTTKTERERKNKFIYGRDRKNKNRKTCWVKGIKTGKDSVCQKK